MLEELKNQVQQKVNLNHKSIVLAFYQLQINKHNELCGCDYCNLLQKYIDLKLHKTRVNRAYEYELDVTLPVGDYLSREYLHLDRLIGIKGRIKELKLEKDKLKIVK